MTDNKQVRKFGCVAFIFFGILFALGVWRQKPVPTYLFGLLFLIGFGFILLPAVLTPLYEGWIKVSHKIGLIITAIMLALAYYLVMTPFAWAKRIFGGRPLPTQPDINLTSYWVDRSEPAQSKERFLKRY
ncbi:MAG TPA: hypothetical protein ENI07_00970 [Desulfobacterales bacterium]|nr:hypothetical protein [Desulfobacterales bacterium]